MKMYESGEYRATKNWPYSICAGCVVFRRLDNKIEILLLVRKAGDFPFLPDNKKDTYHLPKGHVNINETLEAAAMRETAEEAGCNVKIESYLGAKLNHYDDTGIIRDKTIHYFAASWINDLEEMDAEHSNKQWFELEEAIKKVGDKNPKQEDKIIKRLQKFLEISK